MTIDYYESPSTALQLLHQLLRLLLRTTAHYYCRLLRITRLYCRLLQINDCGLSTMIILAMLSGNDQVEEASQRHLVGT